MRITYLAPVAGLLLASCGPVVTLGNPASHETVTCESHRLDQNSAPALYEIESCARAWEARGYIRRP